LSRRDAPFDKRIQTEGAFVNCFFNFLANSKQPEKKKEKIEKFWRGAFKKGRRKGEKTLK